MFRSLVNSSKHINNPHSLWFVLFCPFPIPVCFKSTCKSSKRLFAFEVLFTFTDDPLTSPERGSYDHILDNMNSLKQWETVHCVGHLLWKGILRFALVCLMKCWHAHLHLKLFLILKSSSESCEHGGLITKMLTMMFKFYSLAQWHCFCLVEQRLLTKPDVMAHFPRGSCTELTTSKFLFLLAQLYVL